MEIVIDPNSVVLTLSTFYPRWYRGNLRSIKHTDKVRGDLALNLIRRGVKTGYKIVIVDAKSNKSFRKQLDSINGIKLIKKKIPMQRSPSRRLAFKTASKLDGVKVIVYTDPEKVSLVENCIPNVVEPILGNKADIVIPKREENLFKDTYPQYQYFSESEGNKLYNELLRTNEILSKNSEDLDLFFGPKAFKNDPKILSLFLRKFSLPFNKKLSKDLFFDPEDFSNVIFFPVVLALKKKLRVKSVEIKFSYPQLQRKNEGGEEKELFVEKRRTQKLSALVELMYFIQSLERRTK